MSKMQEKACRGVLDWNRMLHLWLRGSLCKKLPHVVKKKIALLAPAPQGRPNTKVYSLKEGDVTAGLSTSALAQLSISNLSLYALINLGATYSYIASRLCDKLKGNRHIFSTPFFMITPAGNMYQSTTWYKDVLVKV